MKFFSFKQIICVLAVLFLVFFVFRGGAYTAGEEIGVNDTAVLFLWIVVIILAAKISSLVERFGQPSVLGEIIAGVILGNLALVGFRFFEPIEENEIILFLSELGVVILLFQIGLESDIHKMRKVGIRAFLVACIGVVVPFALGTYIVGPWLLPGLSFGTYLFLGAALTATSVGITARVFRDLGKLQIREAQIVLGAAVIDDVLGLVILAVVSAIVTVGAVSLGMLTSIMAKVILFFIGAFIVGQIFAGILGKAFSKIHTGVGMKFTLAISFGLFFAYLASRIGLVPIVGAFAAGIILDPVHFRFFRDSRIIEELREAIRDVEDKTKAKIRRAIEHYADRHIEDLIEPVSYLFVPIFFVVTGMQMKLETLFNPSIIFVAIGITAVAFVGKIVSGFAAGKVNKALVGWGMVPRGEVGLIFAMIGKSLGVVSDEIFSVIIIMVIFTTFLTPPILTFLLKRHEVKHT